MPFVLPCVHMNIIFTDASAFLPLKTPLALRHQLNRYYYPLFILLQLHKHTKISLSYTTLYSTML